MEFTLHRSRVIASKFGRSFEFVKGVPLYVPDLCHEEVMAAGAVPEDELPDDAPDAPTVLQGADRAKAITAAMKKLVLTASREDFAASGAPTVPALKAILGFSIDAKERDALWSALQSAED